MLKPLSFYLLLKHLGLAWIKVNESFIFVFIHICKLTGTWCGPEIINILTNETLVYIFPD